jgi:hypothetical protein
MRFMLLSGGVIDTAEPDADESSMRLSQSWRGYSSLKRTSRAIRASASGRTTSVRRISVNI